MLPGNKPRCAKRARTMGMQLMIGNMAEIFISFLYQTKDAPEYYTGYNVSIAAMFVSLCIFFRVVVLHTGHPEKGRG